MHSKAYILQNFFIIDSILSEGAQNFARGNRAPGLALATPLSADQFTRAISTLCHIFLMNDSVNSNKETIDKTLI